jgi:hypothetical protein
MDFEQGDAFLAATMQSHMAVVNVILDAPGAVEAINKARVS